MCWRVLPPPWENSTPRQMQQSMLCSVHSWRRAYLNWLEISFPRLVLVLIWKELGLLTSHTRSIHCLIRLIWMWEHYHRCFMLSASMIFSHSKRLPRLTYKLCRKIELLLSVLSIPYLVSYAFCLCDRLVQNASDLSCWGSGVACFLPKTWPLPRFDNSTVGRPDLQAAQHLGAWILSHNASICCCSVASTQRIKNQDKGHKTILAITYSLLLI